MTIVTPGPATEAKPTRQDAMRVGIGLDKLNPPPAAIWFPDGTARINVHLYSAYDVAEARPPFEAWLDILGIEEFAETDDGANLKLCAEGTYRGIPVTVNTTVYGHRDATQIKTRKVTR